jgi:type IV pilus assembly protein PilN
MIRINLLPVREARRKADIQQQGLFAAGTLAATLVACAMFHLVLGLRVADARSRVSAMDQQIEQFKPQLAKVESFRKQKAEVEKKLDVIRRLDRSRSGPVHVLDELATHAPQRLWITELAAAKGAVNIEGMSLDNEGIAQFLTALNDSDYFDRVELEETELSEKSGLKLNSFKIHAALTVPGVDEVPPAPVAPPKRAAKH